MTFGHLLERDIRALVPLVCPTERLRVGLKIAITVPGLDRSIKSTTYETSTEARFVICQIFRRQTWPSALAAGAEEVGTGGTAALGVPATRPHDRPNQAAPLCSRGPDTDPFSLQRAPKHQTAGMAT